MDADAMPDTFDENAYDEFFGLCATDDLVVIRPYASDEDDRVLEELRPKYVVMFDADPGFVRRIEVRPRRRAYLLAFSVVRTGLSQFASRPQRPRLLSHVRQLGRRAKVPLVDPAREGRL
jgi:hypothetical protein